MKRAGAFAIAAISALLGAVLPVHADAPLPVLTSIKPEFFVVSSGDTTPVVTIAAAQELQKAVNDAQGPAAPWIVPQPSWKSSDDIVRQCNADKSALGGVVISYYSGYATHFFVLWQSETTTLDVSAEIISCNRTGDQLAPTIVGIVGPLPGSNGTPWVIRRTQISIPLVTVAGYASAALASKHGNNAGIPILAAMFATTANRDIPGYSDPVRLRAISQHLGVDLVTGMRNVCGTTADVPQGASILPRTTLCDKLGLKP